MPADHPRPGAQPSPPAASSPSFLRPALQVIVYVALYFAAAFVVGPLFNLLGGFLVGITTTGLLAAAIANGLCMRIYEGRHLAAIGLHWDRPSLANLLIGGLGGVGAAVLVLGGPLILRAAHWQVEPQQGASVGSFAFVSILLLFGSAGEEMLFRGFGFQVLLRRLGDWPTVLPVGVLFAVLHSANPSAGWLAMANTAGFGILFGYAFLRSHDLWLPMGLHFGWNFTLPVFGVNVSGLTIRVTGFSMQWSAGTLWSGGDYGPEASILTSAVLIVLFVFLWKAPIRSRPSALLDPPAGDVTCVPGQPV
jgi:membrane protease YdiL (CAAX protease family)